MIMDTLGTKLKAARQKRKLTTSEAAKGTRIKVQHIEAIESDDFSSIAAPTYAKGFIRIYAEFLGMNPEPLIEEYTETHSPKPRASLIPEEPQAPKSPPRERKPIQWPALPKVDWRALPERLGLKQLVSRIRAIRWQPSPAFVRAALAGVAVVLLLAVIVTLVRRERDQDPSGHEDRIVIAQGEADPDPDRIPAAASRPLPVIHALPEPYLE